MNKDQIKGVAKKVGGQVQQEVGKLTGDTSTQVKGLAKEAEGIVQKKYGDAKETVSDEARNLDEAKRRKDDLDRK